MKSIKLGYSIGDLFAAVLRDRVSTGVARASSRKAMRQLNSPTNYGHSTTFFPIARRNGKKECARRLKQMSRKAS